VGRQHGELLAARLEEQRQQVVEGRVLLTRAAHPALVAIAERRLVAVVAVGDGDRTGTGEAGETRHGPVRVPVVRDRPQAMADGVVIDDLDVGATGRDVVQDRRGVA
jgi:hypothetical protein